ncbi:MAG: SagB/ThcOx family dehydrogenase [Bacteroidales bacterium]|nr:SagB/ThcOx family dehydrogenase [Bacteroidales bacterium]
MKAILLAGMLAMSTSLMAQNVINLPKPDMKAQSMTVIEALNTRHSVREYAKTPLTDQELSNLCWAACGVSRDNEHRTSPTAMNKKEIRLFVFTEKGVYEYEPVSNKLTPKAKGDHRALMAGGKSGFKQEFAQEAPVSLLMVIDFEKFGQQSEQAIRMGCVDAGNVSENINLYCQSVGLATVPRATHDTEGIRTLLKLTDKQLPIMNNPVGWPKK